MFTKMHIWSIKSILALTLILTLDFAAVYVHGIV